MPQFWIAIFFIVLAIAQLFQSIKDLDLPFPVYLILGAVLAIASNSAGKLSFSLPKTVTISEIKQPNPVLTSAQSPLVTATPARDLTPTAPMAIVSKSAQT
ncbi:hypothetical protein [Chamaesiphon sp.]|uniref:hypothetical protein n=1 Tax=Chamaesiphon sp. TaxID=2814140 RepID=UPI0035941A2E